MAVNLLTTYGKKLDQPFVHKLYTNASVNEDYSFVGVNAIDVLTAVTVAPHDYDNTDTEDRFGGLNELQDTKKTYTLANKKAFSIAIDVTNNSDQGNLKQAGKVLNREIEEQILPLIDKDRLATAAAGAVAATQTVTYNQAEAYENVLDANVFLDEAQAPLKGRALYVTPGFYKDIKTEIVKEVQASGTNDKFISRGWVGELDGVPVIQVPTSYFPANVKAVLIHRDALLGARKTSLSRIVDSERIAGKLLQGLYRYDSFILDAKKNGVASIVE
jgi:hypothetical protein